MILSYEDLKLQETKGLPPLFSPIQNVRIWKEKRNRNGFSRATQDE